VKRTKMNITPAPTNGASCVERITIPAMSIAQITTVAARREGGEEEEEADDSIGDPFSNED
jgi:hypothetical protein